MGAPHEITALLESVVGVFFSDVRHRERAAFILCDELVEMSCRRRAREENHRVTINGFHEAWNASGVSLDPDELGKRVQNAHDHRNVMQHESGAATVDEEYCATAVMDAVYVIEHCWPGARASDFKVWLTCGLRIVRVLSVHGDHTMRIPLEDRMRDERWHDEDDREIQPNEVPIRLGIRGYWYTAVSSNTSAVETILDELDIP